MKRLTKMLLAGATAMFVAAGAVQAQTCASPLVFTMTLGPDSPGYGSATGDTCAASNTFTTYCGGIDAPENDVIVRFRLVTPSTATMVTVTPSSNWDPVIGVLGEPCSPNTGCIADANNGGPGAAESAPVGGPNGVYYMHITASPGSSPPCGAFNVSRTGTPVSLQQFSVE